MDSIRILRSNPLCNNRFVKIIQKFPCLWDELHSYFKDSRQRHAAWVAICSEVFPAFDCLDVRSKKNTMFVYNFIFFLPCLYASNLILGEIFLPFGITSPTPMYLLSGYLKDGMQYQRLGNLITIFLNSRN